MNKLKFLSLSCLLVLCGQITTTAADRQVINLNGADWRLWYDSTAKWQNDRLYLPDESADLTKLPVNPPTGGWSALTNNPESIAVGVPGTVEEYLTKGEPNPEAKEFLGVSWWYRTIDIPQNTTDKRFILHFESVRLRAEVYIDGQLAAYDIVGESPFDADITPFVKSGGKHQLAVRVTNPGGNFHWQDVFLFDWGQYKLPPGRGFGGIIGRVFLNIVEPVHISDIYMQNTDKPQKVNAIVTVANANNSTARKNIVFEIKEKSTAAKTVFKKTLKNVDLTKTENTVTLPVELPTAKIWDLDSPSLYVCEVALTDGKTTTDSRSQTFGFRSFEMTGVGENAILKLNGRRIVLRTAISWGFFPATGLHATPEAAERQIRLAQSLGLNMLNFHRSIGSPIVLETADSLGLLYYEEPGSFQSILTEPVNRTMITEKVKRMVHRDRSHPSLVIYNMINELWLEGSIGKNDTLMNIGKDIIREAHRIDPSRIMTFTSGWATDENVSEDMKLHYRPFDTTAYYRGWFDEHRANGPAAFIEEYYRNPSDNFMHTGNETEIYFRGEEGALSAPPRIEKIYEEISRTGKTGWDGHFWLNQYKEWKDYFAKKDLAPFFGNIDSLNRLMSYVSFYHQGRRIQDMRMQNVYDGYAVNGWESMPFENNSGIVDIYRYPKGDPEVIAHYNQPLFVAVAPRHQIYRLPSRLAADFYIVNEKDLKGKYTLTVSIVSPEGKEVFNANKTVNIAGGETYGQLLWEDVGAKLDGKTGHYTFSASLTDANGASVATGSEKVLGIAYENDLLAGAGCYAGSENSVSAYYKKATKKSLPALDTLKTVPEWIVAYDSPERKVDADRILNLVKNEGATLILIDSAQTWMPKIAEYAPIKYTDHFVKGTDWVGGIYFVKDHPLFEGLPVNCALGWEYQAPVQRGNRRVGLHIEGEEMVAGLWRSTPFNLGSAVGIIRCGRGKIIFSTLDLVDNLNKDTNASETARRLFCNFVKYKD